MNYEQRIIAFIDILGFKNMVYQSGSDASKLDVIMQALEYLKTWETPDNFSHLVVEMEEDYQKKNTEKFMIAERTTCTCFSDSIAVSVGVDDSSINETTSTFIANLSRLGAELMRQGILLRGGVTIGRLIHSCSGIVVGPAMIKAYELESGIACMPRIVLSDELLDKLMYPLNSKVNRYPYHQYLQRFHDGCVGFHQMIFYQVLEAWVGLEKGDLRAAVEDVRSCIIEGLDESFQRPSVHQKYRWLKDAYNELVIDSSIKLPIHELNDNIPAGNIHYSYTDDFYAR